MVHTLINRGQTFDYHVKFPATSRRGSIGTIRTCTARREQAVQGGASGAIVVDGIENLQPAVAGLPERMLVIRDQNVAGAIRARGGAVPSWDVTLNYVPIAYPALDPGGDRDAAGPKEFWRVVNASADTVIDLQLSYDGVDQPLEVVALDGVPTGRRTARGGQDRDDEPSSVRRPDAPIHHHRRRRPRVARATLETWTIAHRAGRRHDTAPHPGGAAHGDRSARQRRGRCPAGAPRAAARGSVSTGSTRATSRRSANCISRKSCPTPTTRAVRTNFFITVDGATPARSIRANPPAIITTQGRGRGMDDREPHRAKCTSSTSIRSISSC